MDRCLLGGLGFGEAIIAYLRDRNCSSILQRKDGNWLSVTSPVQASACGNILEVSVFMPWLPGSGVQAGGGPLLVPRDLWASRVGHEVTHAGSHRA